MALMLCRNRVKDYEKWKAIFDSHLEAQRNSGLHLTNMWRSVEDPNNVFFIFDVLDERKARAFVESPDAAKAGEESGVVDGEIHFVDSVPVE